MTGRASKARPATDKGMINLKSAKISADSIINICYGTCIFVFVLGQSTLLSALSLLRMLCMGFRLAAAILPALLFLRNPKFNIHTLAMWGLIALLIAGNIFLNQADSDLVYIIIFVLYCSRSKPGEVLKSYAISASLGVALVVAAWLAGVVPAQSNGARQYLGFRYTTFGPNLFLHIVLAYIASRGGRIKVSRWLLIELINLWFFKMTDTLAVFLVVNLAIVFYYVLCIGSVRRVLFEGKILRRIVQVFPFAAAALTILAQVYYIQHYNEPMLVTINTALSNRPYFGKIAIERYGVSLFGQPIAWLTGTDGTKVSGMDYFYVDSSYLQVLLRYGILMLIVLCFAMTVVQYYSVLTRNMYLCLGCTLFLIHCVTDPQLLSFRYNPFIIVAAACFAMVQKQRKASPRRRRRRRK